MTHFLKVELQVRWGEPIELSVLAQAGITVNDCPSGWVVLLPVERPDLAEELCPGCTTRTNPCVAPSGARFWLIEVAPPIDLAAARTNQSLH